MARKSGNATRLRRYWTRGAGAAQIGWGTAGDFQRCVTQVSKYMTKRQARGYCANRHKAAVGKWPGARKAH